MNKLTKKGLILLLGAVLLISACTPRSRLIGRWKSTNDLSQQGLGDLIFEFTKDGLLRISVSGVAVDLQYEFADDDTLRFIASEEAGGSLLAGQEVDWKVVGDTLTLISADQPMEFIRVPAE